MPRKKRILESYQETVTTGFVWEVNKQLRSLRRLYISDVIFRDEGDGATLQLTDGYEDLWVKFTISPFKLENRKVITALTMQVAENPPFEVGCYNRTVYATAMSGLIA